MVAKVRIPYNKKDKGSKQMGHAGPRDAQRRLSGRSYADINMPKVDLNELKNLLLNNQKTREEIAKELQVDLHAVEDALSKRVENGVRRTLQEEMKTLKPGEGLPFDVVQQKIEEAVRHTQEEEKKRYESGLGNLNSQLNQAKSKVGALKRELIEKSSEADKARMRVGLLEKELKEIISKLGRTEEKLEYAEKRVREVEKERKEEVGELRSKITELIERISSGEFTMRGSDRSYSDTDRPKIEDVFIDPLGELVTELDPHINVDAAEATGAKRDLKSDVDKLKNLLNKGKYKPVKGGKLQD